MSTSTFNKIDVVSLSLNGEEIPLNTYFPTTINSETIIETHVLVENVINLFCVDTTINSYSILLPIASENPNTTITIADKIGNASVNNIVIEVDVLDILRSPTTITTDFGSYQLISDGISTWNKI